MSDNPMEVVVNVLGPFTRRISRTIEPVDRSASELAYSTVVDDALFERLRSSPAEVLAEHGVNPSTLDAGELIDIVGRIRDRVADANDPFGKVASSIQTKETSEGAQYNFDHSSSWFMNKEGYNVMHEAGTSESKSTSQLAGTEKGFAGSRIVEPRVLQAELENIYFPSQPLVTPELMDRLRVAFQRQEDQQ